MTSEQEKRLRAGIRCAQSLNKSDMVAVLTETLHEPWGKMGLCTALRLSAMLVEETMFEVENSTQH